jgi:hypothetical protein
VRAGWASGTGTAAASSGPLKRIGADAKQIGRRTSAGSSWNARPDLPTLDDLIRDSFEINSIRFHDLRHTFGTIAVQAFPLTDVKAFMGHADIQTTIIYVHHVPQHDAADKLSKLLKTHIDDHVGCTVGARPGSEAEVDDLETDDLQGESDAGGGTRTPDTRIMIAPNEFGGVRAVPGFRR